MKPRARSTIHRGMSRSAAPCSELNSQWNMEGHLAASFTMTLP